jgi:hypothetical protein
MIMSWTCVGWDGQAVPPPPGLRQLPRRGRRAGATTFAGLKAVKPIRSYFRFKSIDAPRFERDKPSQ